MRRKCTLSDLANYILASLVLRIKGAPKYLHLAIEGPLHARTIMLDDLSAHIDRMMSALVLQNQATTLFERAQLGMTEHIHNIK